MFPLLLVYSATRQLSYAHFPCSLPVLLLRAGAQFTSMLLKMRAQGLDADDVTYRKAIKACAMTNDPTQVSRMCP